jgi:hypothetical protein
MPRLAHIASWSVNRSGRGGSVVRVSGASRVDCSEALGVVVGVDVTDTAGSLRRHYPVRFGRSADPRCMHSALSAHHVV